MFGKKKSADGGEPKPKAAKPSRKGAAKKGSSGNFFTAHAEKLVLGVVVLVFGYLIYDGVSGEGYDPKRQPDQLGQMADKLLNDIRNNDPWPELEKERVIAHDFAKRTEEARQPSDPSLYPVPVMEVQDKGAYEKRGDPELFAPIKVIGQSVVGLIAVEGPENAIDPFEDFEDAEKLEGSKRRDRDSRRAQATAGYGAAGYGAAEGSGGEPGSGSAASGAAMGYGMGTAEGQSRLFPAEYNKGFSPGMAGGMGAYGSEMGGYGMGGSGASGGSGMPGYGGGMGSAPAGVGGAAGGLAGGPAVKEKKTLAKPIFFNAVTALVPHEEMLKEYNEKLRESASFMLPRDMPIYLSFEVQRVEITQPNQKINEEDWKTVTDASKQLAMMKNWLPKFPQQIPDVIDPSAADRALTMPIPPILIRDYRPFVKHPDIDWAWDAGMAQMQQMPVETTTPAQPTVEGQLPGEQAPVGGAMGGYGMDSTMGGYGMGSGAMGGYGGGESAGYGMGGSAMGGSAMGGSAMGGSAMGGYGGESAGYGMDAGSGMGGYGMGGYGASMGGSGMGGYGMGAMARPAPYKMVRFYDQLSDKDVRKTFRYRVRVMMEDPNYPSDRFVAPRSSDMKDDVFARVAKLRQVEDPKAEAVRQENEKIRGNAPRKVFNRTKRFTPWSDASNPIYVRGTEDVYVGRFSSKMGATDPAPEAVLVKLDTEKGAYVPMYAFTTKDGKPKDAPPVYRRGAVLVMQKITTQFPHPITTVMKEWPDYPGFRGWSTVVDIRGNEELVLSDSKDDPLSNNGEMMLLMGDGRVEITSEFDDAFWYRGFTLADEREAADKAGPSTDAAAPTGAAAGASSSSGSR